MLQWRETKVAKIKIANLPDKLKSVKLFTSYVYGVNNFFWLIGPYHVTN